jgi:hypothetical protein
MELYYEKAADLPPAVAVEIARLRDALIDADDRVDDARQAVDAAVRDRDRTADDLASAIAAAEAGTELPADDDE